MKLIIHASVESSPSWSNLAWLSTSYGTSRNSSGLNKTHWLRKHQRLTWRKWELSIRRTRRYLCFILYISSQKTYVLSKWTMILQGISSFTMCKSIRTIGINLKISMRRSHMQQGSVIKTTLSHFQMRHLTRSITHGNNTASYAQTYQMEMTFNSKVTTVWWKAEIGSLKSTTVIQKREQRKTKPNAMT